MDVMDKPVKMSGVVLSFSEYLAQRVLSDVERESYLRFRSWGYDHEDAMDMAVMIGEEEKYGR